MAPDGRVVRLTEVQLRQMVRDLTGPIAWYRSYDAEEGWRVTDFTHGQIEGLRARYRFMLDADEKP